MGGETLLEMRDAVDAIEIKNPCHVGWETMSGDERARHCAVCKLSVYNIAAMTRAEALEFIAEREGRGACVRIFRRADGRVLTRDCSALRPRPKVRRWMALGLVTVLALLLVPGLLSGRDDLRDVLLTLKRTRFYQSTKVGRSAIDWADNVISPPVYYSVNWGMLE